MTGQHVQKAHNPTHLPVLHDCKREKYGVFHSNMLSLLYSEPSSCSVPYMDGLGSGSVARLSQPGSLAASIRPL